MNTKAKVEKKEEEVKITVRQAEKEAGKAIFVLIKTANPLYIESDVRCMDIDTDVCDKCRVRYECFLSNILIIPIERLNVPYQFIYDDYAPVNISKEVERYLNAAKK